MLTDDTRRHRLKSTSDFLAGIDEVPLVGVRGDRWRNGKGKAFAKKCRGSTVYFRDSELMRALGQTAFKEGGVDRMREVWYELDALGITNGSNWNGIGGWYK
jgi:hypothetical protein